MSDGMVSFLKELNIDLFSCEEFRNPTKYARYYKGVVREPSQGAYTYRLWENRYGFVYDEDVVANEWSNNEFAFDESFLDVIHVSFYKLRKEFSDIIEPQCILGNRILAAPWKCMLLLRT